jgi:hypothetical protein
VIIRRHNLKDYAMVKRKRDKKGKPIIYETLHRKLKTEQHEQH